MTIMRIGLDTSKHLFQVHAVDETGQPVLRRRLRRKELVGFFAKLPPTKIGLEACGASHHWARVLNGLGHEALLLPAQKVKPFADRNKNDEIDAEAICEAMTRPKLRFVPVKTVENQAALMLLSTRDLLVGQRTALINSIRGKASEFGVIAAKGPAKLPELLERVGREDSGVPRLVQDLILLMADQIAGIDNKVKALELEIRKMHRANAMSRLLASQPGIGPIGALKFALKVPDPGAFRSARHFAAWVGITPKHKGTAGRNRTGGTSKQGDEDLRRAVVQGASSIVKLAKRGKGSPWLLQLLARKSAKVAIVALANKMARRLWAMMRSGEFYREQAA